MGSRLTIVPMSKREANEFIQNFHRHISLCGHQFCVGASDGGACGVAVLATVARSRMMGLPQSDAGLYRRQSTKKHLFFYTADVGVSGNRWVANAW